jgi:hypothetical protein
MSKESYFQPDFDDLLMPEELAESLNIPQFTLILYALVRYGPRPTWQRGRRWYRGDDVTYWLRGGVPRYGPRAITLGQAAEELWVRPWVLYVWDLLGRGPCSSRRGLRVVYDRKVVRKWHKAGYYDEHLPWGLFPSLHIPLPLGPDDQHDPLSADQIQ